VYPTNLYSPVPAHYKVLRVLNDPAYSALHPAAGDVEPARASRKVAQIASLVRAALLIARPGDVIVEFGAGGGHLGLVLAHLLPDCRVLLLDRKVRVGMHFSVPPAVAMYIVSTSPYHVCTLLVVPPHWAVSARFW